ncbi:MAG TPA: hypothetical protein EYN79_01215 [Planctomycetes bacterium]|nr:hypothetical protein [Planctomycetota bacterium]
MAFRVSPLFLLLCFTILPASPVAAEDLWIYGSAAQGGQRFAAGEPIEQTIWILQGTNSILGFSFGVSVEETIGTVTSVDATAVLLTANGGGVPEFIDVQMTAGGFTVETVICSSPCSGWESGTFTAPIFEFTVAPLVDSGSHVICFTDTLGSPPVPISVTNSQETVTPNDHCATICITEHQRWEFAAHDETVPYDRQTGIAEVTGTLTIGQYPCVFPPIGSPGFAMGLGHDMAILQAISVSLAPPLMEINGGNGPDWWSADIYPNGITLGVVASLVGADEFSFEGETEAALVHYHAVPTSLSGAGAPVITILEWNDGIGAPPVTNIILPGDGAEVPGALIDGTITFDPVDVPYYIRGDINEDEKVDLADAIGLLSHLFGGAPGPPCAEEGDVNADEATDVGDPIWILNYLFSGGAPPSAPFPLCGSVGTDDCPAVSAGCL